MRTTRRIADYVAHVPVSVGFAALIVVTALLAGTFLGAASIDTKVSWAAGVTTTIENGSWWTVVTALCIPWDPFQLAAGVLASLVLLGIAERLLGSVRVLVAMSMTGVVGVTLGVALEAVGRAAGEWWAEMASFDLTLDPLTPLVGALLAASAFAGSLWRRRIRVSVFSFLLTFVLYDGDSSNVYRFIAALTGLFLGAILNRGGSTLRSHRSSHRETRTLLATIVAATAIGPIISLVNPNGFGAMSLVAHLFGESFPDKQATLDRCATEISAECERALALLSFAGVGPFLLVFVPLALLIVAAWGLRKGRRFALWLAIAVNLALAGLAWFSFDITATIKRAEADDWTSLDIGKLIVWIGATIAVPLVVAVLLFLRRGNFTIAAPHSAVVRFTYIVVATFLVLAVAYFAVALATIDAYTPDATLGDLAIDTLKRFIPVNFVVTTGDTIVPTDNLTFVLFQWLGVVFWAVFIVAAFRMFIAIESCVRDGDHQRIRELLRRRGGGTFGFMATWPGNVYWFSPDGEAAVAYRVINGIAITMSDPVCSEERSGRTIREFAAFCDANSWVPVFYSVHGHYLPIFGELGWLYTSIGEETLMRPIDLDMTGKPWKKVRQALNRGAKEGVTTLWTTWNELPISMIDQINQISEQWVAENELPEMGFTLGALEELKDPEVRLMLAVGADGRMQAITSWLPVYRDGEPIGWTMDFMRRADKTIPGIMEFLIASSALHMKEQGIELLSLSGAPLATAPLAVGETPPDPTAMTRLLEFLAKTLEPAYGFSSLFTFKAKFNPRYETIYMAYPDPLALPAIGTAIGKAYLPEVSAKEAISLMRTLTKQDERTLS
ncbi:bifunctional lysylphosphatidylglycerol flippase/synthetase MprF [Luethyella okanaganae]|uniref:Bifunctional lysylphosphatidylglycerol flippase/synthetase MprF n=1 Tax=Luethyella okanaganae TaxID=69372 RepID=A0ABW1VEL7_9MICO